MPDTKQFRGDLEKDLERLERALEVNIPAALDTSSLDQQARQAGVELERLGRRIGDGLADGLERGIGDPVSEPLEDSTRESRRRAPKQGEQAGGAFADGFRRRVSSALSKLPEAEITADSSDADLKVAALRKSLQELGDRRRHRRGCGPRGAGGDPWRARRPGRDGAARPARGHRGGPGRA
jgi:hypothetical protein